MANYTLLREYNKLPTVGVLQKLLNRGGAGLTADGDFGPKTKKAVKDFQRPRGLNPDGVVGKNTWPRVSVHADLHIMDCIDIFDPSLMNLEMQDIIRAGGSPIVIGGACNGVEQAVSDIIRAAPGKIFLLRFHGHGAPGVAGISSGEDDVDPSHRADIAPGNIAELLPVLSRLRPIFGPYGSVEFMHCSTGRGRNGRAVLNAIARAIGVPVSAAVFDQLGGGVDTFRFEGPTYTAMPGSQTLKAWSAALPEFAGMTVA
jgi:hypothetical protein